MYAESEGAANYHCAPMQVFIAIGQTPGRLFVSRLHQADADVHVQTAVTFFADSETFQGLVVCLFAI
jgi:hypothetical protein